MDDGVAAAPPAEPGEADGPSSPPAPRRYRLDAPLVAYTIGDPEGRFTVWDCEGSRVKPGRWNEADGPVIYLAEHFGTAMLEKMCHHGDEPPLRQRHVEAAFPAGLEVEEYRHDDLPRGWDGGGCSAARALGTAWRRAGRTAVLFVPSQVAPRYERNLVVNPDHPDFARIAPSEERPVAWDRRLFERSD